MPARRAAGFTLIELMIVVAIIGILAAIAIPAFMKYRRNARTAEATLMLRKMYDGAATYYYESDVSRLGATVAKRFPPSTGVTPGATACQDGASQPHAPDAALWKSPGWRALKFAVDDPHYYQYAFASDGAGVGSAFTARALGDQDCDAVLSTFERVASVDIENRVTGGQGVFVRLSGE